MPERPRGLETGLEQRTGARYSTSESVLVTGAAGGLGAPVVDRFGAGGWQVYAADLTAPFAKLARRTAAGAARECDEAHDPAELADVSWQAATTPRPRARYAVRTDPMRRVLHHLPVPVTERLLRRFLG